jgi:recombination protein RecR
VSGLAPALERLISELCRLPSIGRKTAQRIAFHLLRAPASEVEALATAIGELRRRIRLCGECFNLAEGDLCPICADPRRERSAVCVVEEPANLLAVERTGAHRGLYHVLGGALSPLRDVGPDQLRVRELLERIGSGAFTEVVLATNPNVEGEATAVYLARLLKPARPPGRRRPRVHRRSDPAAGLRRSARLLNRPVGRPRGRPSLPLARPEL